MNVRTIANLVVVWKPNFTLQYQGNALASKLQKKAAGMSLKFLNLKGFHPASQANQKRVWVAEQKAKAREQQEAEAAREVRENADALRFQRLAAAQGNAEAARRLDAQQVGFLYEPPPGLQKAPARGGGEEDGGSHVAEGARCAWRARGCWR